MAGPTDEQWEALINHLACDVELLHGEFTKPNGAVRVSMKWTVLAAELNALPGGVVKTGEQWCNAWKNLQSRARNAYAQRARCMEATGDGGPGVSALHQKVLELTGLN